MTEETNLSPVSQHSARCRDLLAELARRTVEMGDCLLWTGFARYGRYPQWFVDGQARNARRVVWERTYGAIRINLQIGVQCGCPLCVAPEHLVARSKSAAMRGHPVSLVTRARIATALREIPDEVAREIKASEGPSIAMDHKHGLTRGYSARIRRGERWRDYGDPFCWLWER